MKNLQSAISTEKLLDVVVQACHPSYGRKPTMETLWSSPAWIKSEILSLK
jgi:hypothetical protein